MLSLAPLEEKLLRLALCPGAASGEYASAALKFFQALRARGVKAEELQSPAPPKRFPGHPVGVRMPFGRFRNQPIGDVPDSYLRWFLREVRDADPFLRRSIFLHLKTTSERSDG
jgi:hypothetical protein